MRPLFRSELLRFRGPALAAATLHLAVLAVTASLTDPFDASPETLAVALISYALAGLVLGLHQLGTYRRHAWTYLLHRPVAPHRILLALSGASALLLTLVVALPLLLMTLVLRLGPMGVDARHLLLTPFVLGIALSFYLVGVVLVLLPGPARFLIVLLPALFLWPRASVALTFAALLATLGWLGLLAAAAFKPDLETPLEKPLPIAALALPVQLALLPALSFVVLLVYSFGVILSEAGWRGFTTFGWNDYYPRDTYAYNEYRSPGQALALALERSGTEESRALLAALEHEKVDELMPRAAAPPRRGQLLTRDRGQTLWTESRRGVLYTFSHDRMLFLGRDVRSGQPAGTLGPASGFDDVPEVVAGRLLMTTKRVYGMDPARPSLFEAPVGETIQRTLAAEDGTLQAVLTDRALHLLKPRAAVVPIPGDVRNLSRVLVAIQPDSTDSTLVSFVLGAASERDAADARQTVGLVDGAGVSRTVADLPLRQGPPAWARHRMFLVSPSLTALVDLLFHEVPPLRARPPSDVLALAAALALVSAALTALVARRRGQTPRARWAWTAASLLTSVPGLLGFLLLTPRSQT